MKILFFDLETSPITAHTWGLWQQNISLSQIIESTEVICFGARWYGQKKVTFKSVHHDGRLDMLQTLHDLMDEADVLVGWNSKQFDHKHVNREFVENGFLPPSPTKDLDLMSVVKSRFRFPSNKLDYVAQKLGVGAKVQHTGFDLWVKCMAGDDKAWTMMKKYQIQDVDLLVDLYEILKPWMGTQHPNTAAHDNKPDGCIVCGGTELTVRGRAYSSTGSYSRYVCKTCGKWQRGRSSDTVTEYRNL